MSTRFRVARLDRSSLLHTLAALLKSDTGLKRNLICRGDDECELLKQWVASGNGAVGEVTAGESSLRDLIEACDKCGGTVLERKMGVGAGENGVFILLNPPRLVNRVEKKLLKTESVDLLKKIVNAAKLQFNECYITSMVKCEIDGHMLKPSGIVGNCSSILMKEIEKVKPSIAIVFGDIIPVQNIIKNSTGIDWYNIDHPITLIKNPELKRNAWKTLKIIMARRRELGLS